MDSTSYILAIDQSTQGTKATIFDKEGRCIAKASCAHTQIVTEEGYLEHDPEEIMTSVLSCARDVVKSAHIPEEAVVAIGLTNQRETCLAWDKITREPLAHAIVWQCSRAQHLIEEIKKLHPRRSATVARTTGLSLSPLYPAAKYAWLLTHKPQVKAAQEAGTLAFGTIDSWLAFKLCTEHPHVTEPSNASRTQLMDIHSLSWSEDLLDMFGIKQESMPIILKSNAIFGHTSMGGLFPEAVPVCAMMGDSQSALFAQGCTEPGMVKATFGTGSSVMMQTGTDLNFSTNGLTTSVAWLAGDKPCYVLEGNITYAGATISWLKDKLGLIEDVSEVETLCRAAHKDDHTQFVPAFTGLGAPWWLQDAEATFTGITSLSGKAELVRAAVDSIAEQVTDVIDAMREDTTLDISLLQADGGPTSNAYLMEMLSYLADVEVNVSGLAELSAAGVAQMAGQSCGLYDGPRITEALEHTTYKPVIQRAGREALRTLWKKSVEKAVK